MTPRSSEPSGQRWWILRLHVEDEISLAGLARETGISLRTLQRWRITRGNFRLLERLSPQTTRS